MASAAAEAPAVNLEALDAAELRPLVSELRRETAELRGRLARGEAETAALRARLETGDKVAAFKDGCAAAAASSMSASMLGELGHNSIENGMRTARGGQADITAQAAGALPAAGQETLRSARRPPAEPAKLKRERPMHLVVNIMPGAMVKSGSCPDSVNLMVHGPVFVADIKRQLAEAGLSWGTLMPRDGGPLDPPEGQSLEGARLLFRGMPLKADLSLQAQGVADGCELRLLRARTSFQRGAHELRVRGGGELAAPRGLLMNPGLPPWQPGTTRRGPEDFFDVVHREDPGHVAHLQSMALMKKGRPDSESVFTVR